MDIKLKRELVKVRNAVRRKLQALKEGVTQHEFFRKRAYEPLTGPLEELAAGIRQLGHPGVKKEAKEEIKEEKKSGEEVEPPPKRRPMRDYSASSIQMEPTADEGGVSALEDFELSTLLPVRECDEERCVEYTRSQIRDMVNSTAFQEFLKEYDELPRYYVEGLIADEGDEYHNTNGVKYDLQQDKFFIGDEEMVISGKDIIVKGIRYEGTPGLYELLLKKTPQGYKQSDMENFKRILEETRPDNPFTYIQNLIHDTKGIFDTQYGVRYNPDVQKYYIGDSEMKFSDNKVTVKKKTYNLTHGLLELLFKKDPVAYNEVDIAKYKDIVYKTNAHRVGYKSTGQIAGNKGKKYTLLKKLFGGTMTAGPSMTSTPTRGRSGKGLWMETNDRPVEYVYFDDPNELCDRLKLLLASTEAGNMNHTNEVASILEELRECGIID